MERHAPVSHAGAAMLLVGLLAMLAAAPAAGAAARRETGGAVNQPPVAVADLRGVVSGGAVAVTLAGSDPDGDPLTFAIATPPANGALSGAPPDLVYTPAPGFRGRDTFTFTVSDGRATSTAEAVTILVMKRAEFLGVPGAESAGLGINAAGHVVGWARPTGPGGTRGFVWNGRGGVQEISAYAGGSSYAFDVDDTGRVVGGGEHADWSFRGFVWTGSDGMVDTGAALPQAVTDTGRIAGESEGQAFVGDASGAVTLLPALGGARAFATSLDRSGRVVGAAETADGRLHAVLWDGGGGVRDLGILPGGTYSVAHRITGTGRVVGEADDDRGDVRAFVWDEAAGMRALPGLPGGAYAVAYGANDAGQIVGEALGPSWQSRAVLWDADGTIADLGDFGGGYASASAINAVGQVAGQAQTAAGETRAVLWEPPLVAPTPAGRAVAVAFRGGPGAPAGAGLVFDAVRGAGQTTLTTSPFGPDAPTGFTLASPATYFDVTSSARTSGAVDICVGSGGRPLPGGGELRLLQFDGAWTDVTVALDETTGGVCGRTATLSTFVVAARPRPAALGATVEARPDRWRLRPAGHERVTLLIGNLAGHQAREIDPASLRVNGVVPVARNDGEILARVVKQRKDFTGAALQARFDLAAILETLGAVRPGQRRTVTVDGRLRDGTPFTGSDEVMMQAD